MFYLQLALAGGLGAVLRVLLYRWTVHIGWTALPFGTLMANLIGSFLIGLLAWLMLDRWQLSSDVQVIYLSGLLGGFTTFSAFSLETLSLIQSGQVGKAFAYVFLSVFLGVLACWLGLSLAKATF